MPRRCWVDNHLGRDRLRKLNLGHFWGVHSCVTTILGGHSWGVPKVKSWSLKLFKKYGPFTGLHLSIP
jgi:hypothetical protein